MPIQHNLPHAPATLRNREPIRSVLDFYLQTCSTVLEIASGTGEHIAWLAPQYPHVQWQPSDINDEALAVINAYNIQNPSVLPAVALDTQQDTWPLSIRAELISCVNMTHISAIESTFGLFEHGLSYIKPNGLLYLYGPFNKNKQFTSEGNRAFHISLQQQNPDWGLRNIEDLIQFAENAGWSLIKLIDMPANNMSVIFQAKP